MEMCDNPCCLAYLASICLKFVSVQYLYLSTVYLKANIKHAQHIGVGSSRGQT